MVGIDGEIARRPAMEGDAMIPTVVVWRFIGIRPDRHCEAAMSQASLPDQYWRIVDLGGKGLWEVDSPTEPHMIFRSDQRRYAATVGCNRLMGRYTVNGNKIEFARGATTRMACAPPLDRMEQTLLDVLDGARSWSISGKVLKLFDETGAGLATFEAVYLR